MTTTRYWGGYFGEVERGTENAPLEFEYTVKGRCAERVPLQSQLYGHIRVACGRQLPCERHPESAPLSATPDTDTGAAQ